MTPVLVRAVESSRAANFPLRRRGKGVVDSGGWMGLRRESSFLCFVWEPEPGTKADGDQQAENSGQP